MSFLLPVIISLLLLNVALLIYVSKKRQLVKFDFVDEVNLGYIKFVIAHRKKFIFIL